mgnify:CR=1 FL=1
MCDTAPSIKMESTFKYVSWAELAHTHVPEIAKTRRGNSSGRVGVLRVRAPSPPHVIIGFGLPATKCCGEIPLV